MANLSTFIRTIGCLGRAVVELSQHQIYCTAKQWYPSLSTKTQNGGIPPSLIIFFNPFEVEKIKSIPIFSFTQLDLLFWPSTSYGNYAVKLGHQLLRAEEDSELASISNGAASRSFWNI